MTLQLGAKQRSNLGDPLHFLCSKLHQYSSSLLVSSIPLSWMQIITTLISAIISMDVRTATDATPVLTSATSLSDPTVCNGTEAGKLNASNLALAANSRNIVRDRISAVAVSGHDLTQYLDVPSVDTPFERFLKAENRLQRMATSPWICRVNKL